MVQSIIDEHIADANNVPIRGIILDKINVSYTTIWRVIGTRRSRVYPLNFIHNEYFMNKWWNDSQQSFFYIWCLYTLSTLHNKFQPQRTSLDLLWIIDGMTVNIMFFFIFYIYMPSSVFIPNFIPKYEEHFAMSNRYSHTTIHTLLNDSL